MCVYLVTLDLKADRSYPALCSELVSYNGCHFHESCWLIESYDSATHIKQNLCQYIGPEDRILIAEMRRHWDGLNLIDRTVDWLRRPQRLWA